MSGEHTIYISGSTIVSAGTESHTSHYSALSVPMMVSSQAGSAPGACVCLQMLRGFVLGVQLRFPLCVYVRLYGVLHAAVCVCVLCTAGDPETGHPQRAGIE